MKKSINQYVESFGRKLNAGLSKIFEAAKEYAEAVINYPDKAEKEFHKAFPQVTETTWDKLRLVGSGSAVPAIMLVSDRLGFKIARMPIDKQRAVFGHNETIGIVNAATGKIERVRISEIKPRHETILFDESRNAVRSIAEQRKFLEERTAETKPVSSPYEVQGNVLVVRRACRIGFAELVKILERMA